MRARTTRVFVCFLLTALPIAVAPDNAAADVVEVSSIRQLAEYASKSGNTVRVKPGVYRMSDHLTDDVVAEIRKAVPAGPGRHPVWMMRFAGSDNRFEMRDVVLEIETELYPKLPRGYTRGLFISGNNNVMDGLTIRNTGPNQGSGGNMLSIFGNGNTLENVTLHVRGSKPYGYGDLLGKGGPNLVGLQKQSGIMVAGRDNLLRRCKVISRAFGHCFYIQEPEGITTDNIRLEDCYAEGAARTTADMLRETSGHVVVRNSRGDTKHGPLLYLRGGTHSEVELELTGEGSDYTVHALATIAGEGHRVRLVTHERDRVAPAVPIMLGFRMPAHAEMASPIRPAAAKDVELINELPRHVVITGAQAMDCIVRSAAAVLTDEQTHDLPNRSAAPADDAVRR